MLLGGAGASAADPVVGSERATAVPPIARWDVVPFQRIQGSEPFRMGVVAFSQQGIAKVEFRISGQGYRGGVKEAGAMARNPRTGVWEYWVPLEAREFSADGPIEVEAVVHGKDGGTRSKDMDNDGVPDGLGLDPLVLNVNPGGTLPRREAWVSLSGSDETGEAGDRRRPFATIRGAALGLADSSRSIDGCVVRLEEGDHTWNGAWAEDPGYRTTHEWFTVTRAAGAARERTRIVGSDKPFNNLLTRVAGLTLANPTLRGGSGVLSRSNRIAPGLVWTDRNHHQGSGRDSGHDPSQPYDYGHDLFFSNARVFMTDCEVTDLVNGETDSLLIRNTAFQRIGNDAMRNVPLAINVTAHDLDNGPTSWHSDAWQYWGPTQSNVILLNYRATGIHYQGIMVDRTDGGEIARDIALVNNYFEMEDPVRDDVRSAGAGGGALMYWSRTTDNLILWHNTFRYTGANASAGGLAFYAKAPDDPMTVTRASIKANVFPRLAMHQSPRLAMDASSFDFNAYGATSGHLLASPGATAFTGDGARVELDGSLPAGSRLIDALREPLVPFDGFNRPRTARPDVGAMERVSEADQRP